MTKTATLFTIALLSLTPLPALAADATTQKVEPAKPGQELHGFDKYWSMMDPSGKGFVTKDEWLAHAADRFKEIDTNNDGKITKDEMRAYDQKMYQRRQEMRAARQAGQAPAQGQPAKGPDAK